jgi:hypothetical protein
MRMIDHKLEEGGLLQKKKQQVSVNNILWIAGFLVFVRRLLF